MRWPFGIHAFGLLLACLAGSPGGPLPVSAQSLGDQPLAVPQAVASPREPLVQRLPAVKQRPQPSAAPAPPSAEVRRFPVVFPESEVLLVAPSQVAWGPDYLTPREQFVPTAWLRWAQQEAPSESRGQAANGESGGNEANEEKKPEIGPKPPEDVNKHALRGLSLLLKPGELQYELSPLYVTNYQQVLGLLPDNSITLERIRSHLLILPISVRYGWKENTELFAVTPFGLSMYQADNLVRNLDDQTGVLGDITLGFVRNLPKFKLIPNTTLTVSLVTPTGVSPDGTVTTNQAALGNGVWRIGAMLNFIQSVDPFVLYAGLGYDHPFVKELGSRDLQLGDSLNFYAGMGFSVTDDLSLSAQIGGALQGESQLDGIHIANSDIEPVSVRFAVMRRLTLKSRVQPFISWGVTPDAADYSMGVRFVHDR